MLLARVAEQLYWAGRYVERAEVTARVVSEHTHVLVDLPTSVPLTWEPLLDVPGVPGRSDLVDERAVVAYLLADPDNPSSVLSAVVTARANLRSTREVLSREAWEALNNLYLYVTSHYSEGIDRWSRGRFLDRVVAESQRFAGIVAGTMSRDATYQFLRLGRSLERADMTCRVLDARAVPLLSAGEDAHVEVQWAALLRSLAALQTYHQRRQAPVAGSTAVELILRDPDLPGSVGHCLAEVATVLTGLPRSEAASAATAEARRQLVIVAAGPGPELHDGLATLRAALSSIHDEVEATYFPPAAPATPATPAAAVVERATRAD